MLALYRSGRQADALDVFQEARRVLMDELALEPGPELRRLQEAILAHDPAIAPVPLAPRPRGNVPAPSTSFVDREAELAQVVELLREHRLVTLTGPPGVGKSRLALEAARSLESELRGGAWHVGLANAGSAADVVRLVTQAVDARGADPLARVVARLRDTDAILVFDACEHVLEEAARVVSAVLAECPGVRVLATSREVLHVVGEVRVIVDPLRLPDRDGSDAVDAPAVELFTARARAARPGFELTDEDAWLAAEISRLVDGLPLAIELAAARVNVLGLAELARPRPAPPRSPPRAADLGCGACRARDARRMELRPPARGREDPAPPCRGAPRRCASPRTRRGGRRPRSRRDDRSPAARDTRRQVHRHGLVPERRRALRPARHGPRLRTRASCRARRAVRGCRRPTRSTTRR